jgi:rsbT co-antagonist protein RsbR
MLRTLTGKVTLAIGLYLLLLTLNGIYSVRAVQDTATISSHLTEHTIPFALASGDFQLHLARAFTEIESLARDPDEEETRTQVAAEREAAAAALATLKTLATEADEDAQDTHTTQLTLQQQQEAFFTASTRAIDAVLAGVEGGNPVAVEAAFAQIETLEEEFGALSAETDALVGEAVRTASTDLNGRNQTAQFATPLGFVALGLIGLGALWFLRQAIVAPLLALAAGTRRVAAGDLRQRVSVTSTDEIGNLQQTFNTMTANLASQQQTLVEREQTLTLALDEVERRAATQTQLLAEIEQQQTVIAGLSVPVLPIAGDTLVMPLVGALDEARIDQVRISALEGIERSRARRLILDITGVPVIDTPIAQGLLNLAAAVRLLGARVLLVGVQPEAAQGIVSAGLSLDGLITYRDLAAAIVA